MTLQVFLDVETKGLGPLQRGRVIEIGWVEAQDYRLAGRTFFNRYCNPERSVSAKAPAVHGLESLFLRAAFVHDDHSRITGLRSRR